MSPEIENRILYTYPDAFYSREQTIELYKQQKFLDEPEVRNKIFPKIGESNFPHSISFSFDHGDGWIDLIECFCSSLAKYKRDRYMFSAFKNKSGDIRKSENILDIKIVQIKEKYGSLRIYLDGYSDPSVDGMVTFAEKFSEKICEYCGDKAVGKSKGWIRNLCRSCLIIDEFEKQGFPLK